MRRFMCTCEESPHCLVTVALVMNRPVLVGLLSLGAAWSPADALVMTREHASVARSRRSLFGVVGSLALGDRRAGAACYGGDTDVSKVL